MGDLLEATVKVRLISKKELRRAIRDAALAALTRASGQPLDYQPQEVRLKVDGAKVEAVIDLVTFDNQGHVHNVLLRSTVGPLAVYYVVDQVFPEDEDPRWVPRQRRLANAGTSDLAVSSFTIK